MANASHLPLMSPFRLRSSLKLISSIAYYLFDLLLSIGPFGRKPTLCLLQQSGKPFGEGSNL